MNYNDLLFFCAQFLLKLIKHEKPNSFTITIDRHCKLDWTGVWGYESI